MRRIVTFVLGTLALGIGAPVAVTEVQIAALPAHEKFVVERDRVVGYRVQSENATTTVVQYGYTDNPSTPLPNEVFELRTRMSETIAQPNDSRVVTFSEPKYEKVGDTWYDLAWATTTLDAYNLQKRSVFPFAEAQTTDTFTSSDTWNSTTCGTADVDVWGAGGGGDADSDDAFGGGGGGAYSQANVDVSYGTNYTVTVGTGGSGTSGGDGGDSWFGTTGTVFAEGGTGANLTNGGAGGSSSNGVGTTKFSGGNGGNVFSTTGGGGGGGAGDVANGSNGSSPSGGAGGTSGGGDGGDGGSSDQNGQAGNTVAGGGGGAGGDAAAGGNGARGEVRITYTVNEGCYPDITTSTSTDVLRSSATANAVFSTTSNQVNFAIGFEYGIGAFDSGMFSATSTVESATSSPGSFSDPLTSLTTFDVYGFRAYASTTDGVLTYGTTHQFFTADVSTSVPVVVGDRHAWDLSSFNDGTHSTTTSTSTDLALDNGI